MMKSILKYALITGLILLSNLLVASHIGNTWITYTHINGDTTKVSYHVTYECNNLVASSISATIYGCNDTITGTAVQESTYQIPNGFSPSLSSCTGGYQLTYQVTTYSIIIITPYCDSLISMFGSCCSPPSINYSNPSHWNYAYRFTTNNTSVQYTGPFNYTFDKDSTQTHTIGLGYYDPDGDSLYFELDNPPITDSTGSVPSSPYTSANPYPWISLDSNTGEMEITPPGIGNYTVYLRVKDYDSNGILKGVNGRQFSITFVDDSLTTTDVESSLTGVSNVTGGNYANHIFTTTPGSSSLCFDLTFTDTNLTDTLYFFSNIYEALPGATITTSGINPLTASICWTYSLATGNQHHFKTTLRDQELNSFGFNEPQEYEFLIKLWGTLPSVQDSAEICQGGSYQINAGSADSISWISISGDPLIVGTNFSCDDCSNPTASPLGTTTYRLWSQTQGFVSIDTITINVNSPMTNSGLPSVSTICEGDSLTLSPNTGIGNVAWLDYLGDSLSVGQNIGCVDCYSNWIAPSDTTSIIFVSDQGGLCEFRDTITVNVGHLPSSLMPSSTIYLCGNDSAGFVINNVGSYQWNAMSGSAIVNGNSISCDTCGQGWLSPDSNSLWTVSYSIIPGCSFTDTVTIEHNYLAPMGLPNSLMICEGDSVLITSSATGYHSWSYLNTTALIGINISSITGDSIYVFPSVSDKIIAHNNVGMNCYQIDTIPFSIQNLQSNLGLPNGATICVGDSIVLNSTANASVQWTSLIGSPINVGANFDCDTCANATAWPNQNTIYQITNTYFTGCFEADTIAVSVNDSALIYGTLTGLGLIGTTLFNNSVVTLYQNNGTNWVVEDSTITDSSGYFYFYTNSDSVLVFGTPNQNLYPGTISYYYGNQPNQSMATVIQTTPCSSNDASILIPVMVSIEEIENSDISVFPIPNHGEFTISSTYKGTYEIYTVTGALVLSGKLNTGNNFVTLTNSKGTYFVHINRNNKASIVQIIVE